jgi:putative transposase
MKRKTRAMDDDSVEGKDPLGMVRALTGPYVGMGRRSKWRRRIKELPARPSTCFHLMSRICDGLPMFDETDKEALVIVLRKLARFSGIKLLTYCVMGNHFHALVRVPEREEWLKRFEGVEGEEQLMQHLRLLYSKAFVAGLKLELTDWRRNGRAAEAKRCVADLKRRFCDISVFMRAVKLRFSRWFNKRHGRRGSLWMGRFKSVLVEGKQTDADGVQVDALKVMAAYIDLNPVRAEMVECAEAYRWSGWSAAQGEDKEAREGLCDVVGCRMSLWEARGKSTYGSWVSETRRQVRARKGKAKRGEESQLGLMERVRAFSSGLAVGSEAFVEEVFGERRDLFGSRRKEGARPLDGSGGSVPGELRALRDLRGLGKS